MKFLWGDLHGSIEEKKYIDLHDPLVSQWAIKLHQYHINGLSTMPREYNYVVSLSNTTMSNLDSSVVPMK